MRRQIEIAHVAFLCDNNMPTVRVDLILRIAGKYRVG